jgi:hypothetical protein
VERENDRQSRKDHEKRHEFAALPEFDKEMRKIAQTPKATVEQREKEEKRKRS